MGFLSFVGAAVSLFNPAIGAGIAAVDKGLSAMKNAKAGGANDADAWMAAGQSLMSSTSNFAIFAGKDTATNADYTRAYGATEPSKYKPEPGYTPAPAYATPFNPK